MKRTGILIWLAFLVVACEGPSEDGLLKGHWELVELVSIKDAMSAPADMIEGVTYTFNDSTAVFKSDNSRLKETQEGTWSMAGDTVTVVSPEHTVMFHIQKLNEDSLIWVNVPERVLKFYFARVRSKR